MPPNTTPAKGDDEEEASEGLSATWHYLKECVTLQSSNWKTRKENNDHLRATWRPRGGDVLHSSGRNVCGLDINLTQNLFIGSQNSISTVLTETKNESKNEAWKWCKPAPILFIWSFSSYQKVSVGDSKRKVSVHFVSVDKGRKSGCLWQQPNKSTKPSAVIHNCRRLQVSSPFFPKWRRMPTKSSQGGSPLMQVLFSLQTGTKVTQSVCPLQV